MHPHINFSLLQQCEIRYPPIWGEGIPPIDLGTLRIMHV
jgi:hypothetical protein